MALLGLLGDFRRERKKGLYFTARSTDALLVINP